MLTKQDEVNFYPSFAFFNFFFNFFYTGKEHVNIPGHGPRVFLLLHSCRWKSKQLSHSPPIGLQYGGCKSGARTHI